MSGETLSQELVQSLRRGRPSAVALAAITVVGLAVSAFIGASPLPDWARTASQALVVAMAFAAVRALARRSERKLKKVYRKPVLRRVGWWGREWRIWKAAFRWNALYPLAIAGGVVFVVWLGSLAVEAWLLMAGPVLALVKVRSLGARMSRIPEIERAGL